MKYILHLNLNEINRRLKRPEVYISFDFEWTFTCDGEEASEMIGLIKSILVKAFIGATYFPNGKINIKYMPY